MRRPPLRLFVLVGLALAVGLAFAVAPYASSSPDGLERVAHANGFLEQGRPASVQDSSPVPDYAFPGIGNEHLATGVAGFAGTVAVFAVALGVGHLNRRLHRGRIV